MNMPDDEKLLRPYWCNECSGDVNHLPGCPNDKNVLPEQRTPEEWKELVNSKLKSWASDVPEGPNPILDTLLKTGPIVGVKHDSSKPRTDLFSTAALMGLADVLTYGANKYAEDNWRKGMNWRRLTGAALRHLLAFQAGEDTDPESGFPHVDHAMCCLMFLSEFQKCSVGVDDRHKEILHGE